MLLSCLRSVSILLIGKNVLHTSVVVYPCIGNQSCSLGRTDMVWLRHTSACAIDSDCKLESPEPISLLDSLDLHMGLDKELAHRERVGHWTEVAAMHSAGIQLIGHMTVDSAVEGVVLEVGHHSDHLSSSCRRVRKIGPCYCPFVQEGSR